MKQLSCRLRLSISSDSHFQRPLHSPSRLANPHSSLQPPIYLLHRNLHLSPKSQGIPGNEKVDATAKAVTSLPRIHSRILPTKADLSLIIRRHIIDHWIALWQNRVPSNKLVQIKPLTFSHSSRPTKHFIGKKGSHVSASTTLILRTPISSLNYFTSRTYIAILTHRSVTVSHMFECPSFASLRLTRQVPSSISIALSNDLPSIHNILSYLQATNFPSRVWPFCQAHNPSAVKGLYKMN